jgi:hypothetical protein
MACEWVANSDAWVTMSDLCHRLANGFDSQSTCG